MVGACRKYEEILEYEERKIFSELHFQKRDGILANRDNGTDYLQNLSVQCSFLSLPFNLIERCVYVLFYRSLLSFSGGRNRLLVTNYIDCKVNFRTMTLASNRLPNDNSEHKLYQLFPT